MKKSLLAVAILGVFTAGAQAQTNVSIGGVVQADFKSYKISNTTRAASNELRVDDDYGSRFWLTGTEDLGGGLNAIFYVENRFNADVNSAIGGGNGLANGDTFIGLKGGFGQVTLGKHSWMAVQGLGNEWITPSGNLSSLPSSMIATFTIMDQAVGYIDITRRANSATYRSPSFSGFSGVVGVSAGSAGNEGVIGGANYNDGREYYLQGNFTNGPLGLGLAYRDFTVEGRPAVGTDDQQLRFTGSYKVGSLKVNLLVDRATREAVQGGRSSRTAWAIPVSYTIGNGTLIGTFAKAGDLSTGHAGLAANTGNNSGAKMYVVGYDYALSRRTSVGAFYSRLDNDARGLYRPFQAAVMTGSTPAAGETASTLAVSVKHNF